MTGFPVVVEQSMNRSSRATFRDGTILIRLAKNLPGRIAEEHVASLTRRMQKLALREHHRHPLDPLRALFQGETSVDLLLYTGERVTLTRSAGKRVSLKRAAGTWILTHPPGADTRTLHRYLWRSLAAQCLPDIERRVRAINTLHFGFLVHRVKLRHTTSQWGSCGRKGQICLNTALLLVPPHLLDYVIIHELAHVQHRSHGPRFWATVAKACPDFRSATNELRNYRLVAP